MAYERRSYAGGGVNTTLTSSINTIDTTIAIAASTGWPSGSGGPFFVVIDRNTSAEEVVKVTTRTMLSLTVSSRAADSTSASSHAAGATIELTFAAVDADEANAHYANVQADPHPMYMTSAETAAAYQPLDSDLTAIAASATTSYGRSLLTPADAPAARTLLGIGSSSISAANVATVESTSSTSFVDLATAGPAVTITTGTTALVTVSAHSVAPANGTSYMGFAISGATTVAASANNALAAGATNVVEWSASRTTYVTGLTAGSNTFTAKYKTTTGTPTFYERNIIVQAL